MAEKNEVGEGVVFGIEAGIWGCDCDEKKEVVVLRVDMAMEDGLGCPGVPLGNIEVVETVGEMGG